MRDLWNTFANNLITWLMQHCTCYTSTFYVMCNQYSPEEVKSFYEIWNKYLEKDESEKNA